MVGGLSWGYVGPSWGYVGLSWGQCGPILGLCWPILGLCWPILGLCWPILGAMLAHVVAMLAHLEAYVGPCWPILNHKIRKMGKNGTSTKHRKTPTFFGGRGCLRQGAAALSPTERRETPSARTRPGGPWPDLGAYARQPARGPTMWAHFVAMLAYVGLCWPIVRAIPAFLHCQLPPCSCPPGAGFRSAQPRSKLESKDPVAGLKHHGSEPRITPAARSPECQTLLSEPTRN